MTTQTQAPQRIPANFRIQNDSWHRSWESIPSFGTPQCQCQDEQGNNWFDTIDENGNWASNPQTNFCWRISGRPMDFFWDNQPQ